MLSAKEELKTDKLILWLDDVNLLRNIILIFLYIGKNGRLCIMEIDLTKFIESQVKEIN